MIGRLVAKRFARALIQPFSNHLYLLIGDHREVAAFRNGLCGMDRNRRRRHGDRWFTLMDVGR